MGGGGWGGWGVISTLNYGKGQGIPNEKGIFEVCTNVNLPVLHFFSVTTFATFGNPRLEILN